jgi:hypothetical protein
MESFSAGPNSISGAPKALHTEESIECRSNYSEQILLAPHQGCWHAVSGSRYPDQVGTALFRVERGAEDSDSEIGEVRGFVVQLDPANDAVLLQVL